MHRLYSILQIQDPANVVISQPTAIDHQYNTEVLIHGSLSQGTYLRRQFRYNRIQLNHLPVIQVVYENESDVLSLLPKLNRQALFTFDVPDQDLGVRTYQAYLEPSDIVNFPISTPSEPMDLHIQAHPNSYVYTGQWHIKLLV